MGSESEYKKRLEIIGDLIPQFKDSVRAIIAGGSVGYHNVISISDIDLVAVVDKSEIERFVSKPYFENKISKGTLDAFRKGKINMFWFSKMISGVELNLFVYETRGYVDYCVLKGPRIGLIQTKPSEFYNGFRFDGSKLSINRNVTAFESGYVYTQPPLFDGVYYGSVPRDDFFYLANVLFEKDKFFTKLEKEVWKTIVFQMVNEYGSKLDLDKVNIINSVFRYNRDKKEGKKLISDTILEKIRKRTERELKNSVGNR